jgi:hypothetical protein
MKKARPKISAAAGLAASLVVALGVSGSLNTAADAASSASFNQLRDLIEAHPQSKLPDYPGLTATSFAKAFAVRTGEIVTRSRATLSEQTDFRPASPKLLHPRGVCAAATWKIDRPSSLTGLFAEGTEVPAIIRFSSGTRHSRLSDGANRMFGLALKLFPTRDPARPVVTKNIFMLDQHGFEGSRRPYYLQPGEGEDEVYFTNVAPPRSALGKLANRFFARFDWHPENRPLYPLAEVDQEGRAISPADAVTPEEIHLVPEAPDFGVASLDDDFRDELLRYGPGEIRLRIETAQGERLGRVTVTGHPVVSEFCDLELHFHHHPQRRALERK